MTKAEQLYTMVTSVADKKEAIELILQFARETAEAQRKADVKIFKEGTDVRLSLIGIAIIMEVNEKPLVTSPNMYKK